MKSVHVKPYLRIVDDSLDTIDLQNGMTAKVCVQDWQEDPLKEDDCFALNFALNAWDRKYRCHRQDNKFFNVSSEEPSFDELCDWNTGEFVFSCQNAQATIDDIGIKPIVMYALFWQHDAYYREMLSDRRHNALMRAYRRLQKQYYFDALGLLDHSRYHFYAGVKRGWDYSTIGFVAVKRNKEWNIQSDEECCRLVKDALEAYEAYANGEIYEVFIEDQNGEIVETHSNFYDWLDIKPFLDANYGLLKEAA